MQFRTSLWKQIILFMSLSLVSTNCVFSQESKPLPNDVKWVKYSVEYAAACLQTYRMAWPIVKEAAAKQTQNWVVVFDVDETVLDNAQYAVERTAIGAGYTRQSWVEWVKREAAPLIPGAKAFIDSVRSLGPKAHIAFITNRDFDPEEIPTISNLREVGLFQDGDTMLTERSKKDTKKIRRECLETGTGRCEKNGPLVILALFGDNVRDFVPIWGSDKAVEYRENIAEDSNWGARYFVLPNPTYGSWVNDYK
ncbi:hypothetical protein IH970_08925 [candidate division KSB1 bacterium]|nr:hypothetical protein [candidate division KSB1 bacterium]